MSVCKYLDVISDLHPTFFSEIYCYLHCVICVSFPGPGKSAMPSEMLELIDCQRDGKMCEWSFLEFGKSLNAAVSKEPHHLPCNLAVRWGKCEHF